MIFMVVRLKEGEKPDYRRIGAKLSQTREEHGGINHDSGETDLLLSKTVGKDKESGEETYRHPKVIGQCPFYTLTCYNTHSFTK